MSMCGRQCTRGCAKRRNETLTQESVPGCRMTVTNSGAKCEMKKKRLLRKNKYKEKENLTNEIKNSLEKTSNCKSSMLRGSSLEAESALPRRVNNVMSCVCLLKEQDTETKVISEKRRKLRFIKHWVLFYRETKG